MQQSMGHHSVKWENVDHQDPDEVPIPDGAEYEIDHHQASGVSGEGELGGDRVGQGGDREGSGRGQAQASTAGLACGARWCVC